MTYLESYYKFVKNGTFSVNFSEFYNDIYNNNDSSILTQDLYDIFLHHKPKDLPSITLNTNGSSKFGQSRVFPYTYNSFNLKDSIWFFMHRFYPDIKTRYSIKINESSEKTIKTDSIYNEGQTVSLNPNILDINLSNSFWIINPIDFHILTKYEHILDYIRNNNIVISLTEVDCSAYDFSKLGIRIVNQMRSWKEGTSFYTCPYNVKHFTENLFYCTEDRKIVDLLNFHSTWNDNPDNIYPISDWKECQCGTWYREMNFEPYAMKGFYDINNNIDPFFQKKIKCFDNYRYLQIIQSSIKNIFYIHVSDFMPEKDFQEITNFVINMYKNENVEIHIKYNKYTLGIRKKNPIFWSEYHFTDERRKYFENIL